MDQLLTSECPFARFVANSLREEKFFLVDVGAAYGVASAWRCFGDKLHGFGFDPDPQEVKRLNEVEPAPGFRYITGFVGIPTNHPFAAKRRGQPRLSRNPWYRLAVERWFHIQRAREQGLPLPANVRIQQRFDAYKGENAGDLPDIINLPEFLITQGVNTIDFLKVDVDGTDFDILQSMGEWYDRFTVLGVGVEVNFFGSSAETSNTFHNTDRFLKGCGFELLDFSIRRYPMQDLPALSLMGLPYPAATAFGRPLQGDAFYARDVCALGQRSFAESLTDERLTKLAAVFSLFGLPDCAAELLVTFRERLASLLDVDRGLDLLAKQAQPGSDKALSYRDYIADFERRAFGEIPKAAPTGVRRSPVSPQPRSSIRKLASTVYEPSRRIVFPGAICMDGATLFIRTRKGRWAHSVEFPLNAKGLDSESRLLVAVSVLVHKGSIGIGILSANGQSLPVETPISDAQGSCLLELCTGPISQSGSLLIRNVTLDGNASEVEISIVSISLLER
jgi:hypothetical protein